MNLDLTVCLTLVIGLVGTAAMNLLSKELESRVAAVPLLLLKLARLRVRRDLRDDLYKEWSAELAAATHDHSERPVSRLLFGLRFAAGILRTASVIARDIGAVRSPLREPVDGIDSGVTLPARGMPHPQSVAELILEKALSRATWAAGRHWNQPYQPTALARLLRLDLWWPDKGCVVEIDGPEHRTRAHFAADHARDVHLQSDGLRVLRFTNDQVVSNTAEVVAVIEKMLTMRS